MSSLHDRGRSRVVPPPIGPDGRQVEPPSYGLIAPRHARQLQAEAVGIGLRRLGRALAAALRSARLVISCAGHGAALRAPGRLTSPCR